MLHDQIRKEMTDALRAKEELRLSVLRGLLAAFTNELVAKKRKPTEKLEDEEVLTVIKRAVKQREDSITQFEKAGRHELAKKEKDEMHILMTYLPKQMSREEIVAIAKAKMSELGLTDKKDVGKLIGAIIREAEGKADGKDVKSVVEELLP